LANYRYEIEDIIATIEENTNWVYDEDESKSLSHPVFFRYDFNNNLEEFMELTFKFSEDIDEEIDNE
jgi:hypothetical protein